MLDLSRQMLVSAQTYIERNLSGTDRSYFLELTNSLIEIHYTSNNLFDFKKKVDTFFHYTTPDSGLLWDGTKIYNFTKDMIDDIFRSIDTRFISGGQRAYYLHGVPKL